MLPIIWGGKVWDVVHIITLGYPEYPTEEDKKNYYKFFYELQFVLPCEKCRNHYTQNLIDHPLTNEILSNKSEFVKWGIDLHNIVNKSTGKKVLTYPEAFNELNKIVKKKSYNYSYIIIIILIIIIFLLLFYIYRIRNE